MQNLALKVVVTPLLIGAASLAGRRWGHHIGGWLVGLPLTSGPVAYFLATEHGTTFAAHAAVGMLAGTISQVAFALAYRTVTRRGWPVPFAVGCAAFAVVTVGLVQLRWSALPTFALVLATLVAGYALTRRPKRSTQDDLAVGNHPRWDIPVRMTVATVVVLAITASAPTIGPHLAGLLSPFPVFGAVLTVFTHHTHGPSGAAAVLGGLITGLAAPAVFFLALALTLAPLGNLSFGIATLAALITQAATMFVLPSGRH